MASDGVAELSSVQGLQEGSGSGVYIVEREPKKKRGRP